MYSPSSLVVPGPDEGARVPIAGVSWEVRAVVDFSAERPDGDTHGVVLSDADCIPEGATDCQVHRCHTSLGNMGRYTYVGDLEVFFTNAM